METPQANRKEHRTPLAHKALGYLAGVFFRHPELFVLSSEPILDRVPIGIYISNKYLHYANPTLRHMLGYEDPIIFREEIQNKGGIQGLYLDSSVKDELIRQQEQQNGKKIVAELDLRRKDGQIITVRDTSIQVSVDKNQNPVYLGVLQDITAEVELRKQLKKEATTDPLTGLLNRRALSEALEREMKISQRYKGALSILMVDIDHFKDVNDRYGHNAGDVVLQQIAKELTKAVRDIDIISRWGGEEFLIVLPSTTPQEALIVAERIRKKVEELRILYKNGENQYINTTISIGVTKLDTDELTAEESKEELNTFKDEFVGRADAALYIAKEGGRNRTVEYAEGMEKKEGIEKPTTPATMVQ